MNIKVIGTISVVSTIKKPYWHKRKGYYVGERWVKPKKKIKYKTVPLKQPHLFGDIQLEVDKDLVLNGMYVDENGKQYICMQRSLIPSPVSKLRVYNMNLGSTFSTPSKLTLVFSQASEGSSQP